MKCDSCGKGPKMLYREPGVAGQPASKKSVCANCYKKAFKLVNGVEFKDKLE